MAERLCRACGEALPPEGTECPFCGAPALAEGPERPRTEAGPGPEEAPPTGGKRKGLRWVAPVVCIAVVVLAAALALGWRLLRPAPRRAEDAFVAASDSKALALGWPDLFADSLLDPARVPTLMTRERAVELDGLSFEGFSMPAESADGSRAVYSGAWSGAERGTGCLFYDRGQLSYRATWVEGTVSPDGSTVFYIERGEEDVLRRWDPEGDEALEIDRGARDSLSLSSVGWAGDALLYNRGGGESPRTYALWTDRGTQRLKGSGFFSIGSRDGVVIRYAFDSRTERSLGWPDETGGIAFRDEALEFLLLDRDGTELLWKDSEGNWWYETARGARPVEMPRGTRYLDAVVPDRHRERDGLLGGLYHYEAPSEQGLLYLGEDLTARVITRRAVYGYQEAVLDPTGDRLLYVDESGAICQMDGLTGAGPAGIPICPGAVSWDGAAVRLLASEGLEECYYMMTTTLAMSALMPSDRRLWYLPGDGTQVQVAPDVRGVQVLPGGGCYFRDPEGRVWFTEKGSEPADTGVLCEELAAVGRGDALAIRRDETGRYQGWLLGPGGAVTPLPTERL